MEQTIPSWAEKKENVIKIENAIRKADDQLINLSQDVPEWIQEKLLDIALELRESTGEPQAEAFFETTTKSKYKYIKLKKYNYETEEEVKGAIKELDRLKEMFKGGLKERNTKNEKDLDKIMNKLKKSKNE